jgi:prepilin peptidase CpaA
LDQPPRISSFDLSLSDPRHSTAASVSTALIPAVILVTILWLSVLSDVRTRKIPNTLILGGVALAAVWQAFGPTGAWAFDPSRPGGVGLAFGAVTFLAILFVFFPLFAIGVMGAGDVKLIAVVAAIVGASPDAWLHLVGLSLSIFVAGGVLAVVWWLASRFALFNASKAIHPTVSAIAEPVMTVPAPTATGASRRSSRRTEGLPFSIAIALGTAVYSTAKTMGMIDLL